jgi:hypothetical protein
MFIKKEDVKELVSNDIIKISKTFLSESIYYVEINFLLFNRLKKIQKLTKSCTHDEIISYIKNIENKSFYITA